MLNHPPPPSGAGIKRATEGQEGPFLASLAQTLSHPLSPTSGPGLRPADGIAFQHFQVLVAGDRGNFHRIEDPHFKEATGGLVA